VSARAIAIDSLLAFTCLSCWLGVLGMVRMRDAYQSLHYLAIPAVAGLTSLTLAIVLQTGWSQASWKCGIIFAIMIASNSVGTHAAARAFRQRQKGHWQPKPEDAEVEFLGGKPQA
jgi:monovalent cation/proton antiporter MnhG/PhaG subunit